MIAELGFEQPQAASHGFPWRLGGVFVLQPIVQRLFDSDTCKGVLYAKKE